MEEAKEDDIMDRYGVEPGDLYRLVENADWLLYACCELARLFGRGSLLPMLEELRARVKAGVRPELLELVTLEGIGRARARALYQAGFRSLRDLREAPISALTKVPGIGPELAKSIKAQLEGGRAEEAEARAPGGAERAGRIGERRLAYAPRPIRHKPGRLKGNSRG